MHTRNVRANTDRLTSPARPNQLWDLSYSTRCPMPEFIRLLDLQLLLSDEFRIRLGEESRTASLYYLGIDPKSIDHDCPAEEALRRLLKGWLTQLANCSGRGRRYLPLDFSDESTQWLACEAKGNTVEVVFGWAPVEGWAISPSEFQQHAERLPGFTPNEPTFVQSFYLPRLLSELRRVINISPRL